VVNQAFQLASRFVTVDTDAAPKSPTAHTADRYAAYLKKATLIQVWGLIIILVYLSQARAG